MKTIEATTHRSTGCHSIVLPALEVKGARKRYGEFEALKGIDLTIPRGQFYALLGMNGAGKSSLIHMITGLSRLEHGQITVLGHNLQHNPSQAKRLIGLVPQEFNLPIFFKVHQILEHYAGYHGIDRKTACERTEEVLAQLGLSQKRSAYARALSGGMKRRLMIARALMHRPPILILDEPTAGVDIELRNLIWQLLEKLNREGTTIILTTHYMEEAEALCERVGIIHHGRMVEEGPMRECLLTFKQDTWKLSFEKALPANFSTQLPYPTQMVDDKTLQITLSSTAELQEVLAYCQNHQHLPSRIKNITNRLESWLKNATQSDIS